MNKNSLIWGAVILVLIAAFYVIASISKNAGDSGNEDFNVLSSQDSDGSLSIQSSLPAQSSSVPEASPALGTIPEGTTPGLRAVDFTLTGLDGQKVSLSNFRGKNVYLNFFATWCPPCKSEMPYMEKLSKEYKDKNLVVIAVDLGEGRDTVEDFISKNQYSFKVLLDSKQTVAEKYAVTSIPASYFIDKNGIITEAVVGALDESKMKRYIDSLYK